MTNAEIASALSISVNTVKTHFRSAYWKLGIHDRCSAVQLLLGESALTVSDDDLPSFPYAAPLTSRQREILARVAIGMTRREIAASLVISPETVKTHVQKAYKTLGVRSARAAIAEALTYERATAA
jgi:DNA-binding NarL/FixJ family response regulator